MIKKIGKISPRLRWILIVLVAILVLLLLLRRAVAESPPHGKLPLADGRAEPVCEAGNSY